VNKAAKGLFYLVNILCLCSLTLWPAEKNLGENVVLYPTLVETAPKIDAMLDEAVWQSQPNISEHFVCNHPVYGEKLPQKTNVWLAYDKDNIYVAFYCYDDEPEKIKASVTRRDNFLSDDWVSIDLDAMGQRQFAYEFLVNPKGIQTDILYTASSGESMEPDYVWYSAGRIVKDGYIVEIRIPLKSIQFNSGSDVSMNLAFYRFVSRTGQNSSWPQIDQNKRYFNSLRPVKFKLLAKQLRLEVLPSITYGSLLDRETPNQWSAADQSTQIGVGIKYGITSSINTEITINPDFSQVESDEFQVETNQRYPIFYNEKRPFFMAVKNQFNLAATGGDMILNTAVHTRNIIDPAWGGKLTGDVGRFSFGFLAAGDEWPGIEWGDEINPHQGQNANFIIGRLKYGLKGDNYLGLIYSSMNFGDQYNRVFGGDVSYRLKGNHNIAFNGIYSFSKSGDNGEETKGGAFTLRYLHSKKPIHMELFLEHYDPDFRMDSAFYWRTGVTKLTGFIGPKFYPNKKKVPWLKRIQPFVYAAYTHDNTTKMDDLLLIGAFTASMSKQGSIRVDFRHNKESWAGKSYAQNSIVTRGSVQIKKWLHLSASLTLGKQLLYDPVNPFLGNILTYSFDTNIQPNSWLEQYFSYIHQNFDKPGGERVYDLDILVSRTTYQFNKYLFIRGLVQYNSLQNKILTDLLASFTLIPGTVVHAGYGSLHQKQYWNNQFMKWEYPVNNGKYYQMARSFFLKVSYLYRF
jgi:Domain of unknown function (DUF5916)/Carbohydrate family 9 binding domain-like